jgi:hypothetical protein
MAVEDIASGIRNAMQRPSPLLFAGAGVGCRVGLPDWNGFIEHLAKTCDDYGDRTSATNIRERAEKGWHASAATVYKTCESIPQGERWKALAHLFTPQHDKETLERLCPLVALGFTAIVTTNYDSSMHNACAAAGKLWARPVELDDDSLKGASLSTDFFIARAHGRASMPTSMVVDTADYDRLKHNQIYLDFLLDILKTRSCLFLGFSFLDPSISHVLDIYEQRLGPIFPKLHTALVPSNSGRLESRLHSLNIETIRYDASQGHVELWQSIRVAFDERSAEVRKESSVVRATLTVPAVQQFMAFAYAQVQSGAQRQPISALVQDGIVLSNLNHVGTGTHRDELLGKVSRTLGMTPDEGSAIVTASLGRLIARGQVQRSPTEERFLRRQAEPNVLEEHLTELVEHVAHRVSVRNAHQLNERDKKIVRNVLEGAFIWRAWDLAAHYAGAGLGVGTDLPAAVRRIVDEQPRGWELSSRASIELAILDLLMSPEDRETPILAKIGRAAFGLQLVLSTPRQALFHRFALPHAIYFDSNVLMPAITKGHPLGPVYKDAIGRLLEASRKSGVASKIAIGEQFIEEIVSHRKLAIQMVEDLDLEDPEKLAQHVLFYGGDASNVFVGGYAGVVGREKRKLTFTEYLRDAAPYTTEAEAAKFIGTLGIGMLPMRFTDKHGGVFAEIFATLLSNYESDHYDRPKDSILIRHEAQQLTQLDRDAAEGRRSLFVTADAHLRRILQRDMRFRKLAGSVVSHLGLIALVDVMVGLEADTRSITRLVWATPHHDQERALFDYFVRLALANYSDGMTMGIQEAAQRVATEAKQQANSEDIDLFGSSPKNLSDTAKYLDRYSNKFFEYWHEANERRKTS